MKRNSSDKSLAMNVSDVASSLKISRSQVFKLVASGRFPKPFRLGNMTLRWARATIENHLENLSK